MNRGILSNPTIVFQAMLVFMLALSSCVAADKEGRYSGLGSKSIEDTSQRTTFVGYFDEVDLYALMTIVEPGTTCRLDWPLSEGEFMGCATHTRY